MKPTLFLLAAGMGSRYGGLKQIDPVDSQGHTIIDYSVYDALRAGFDRIVFVVRPEMESDVRDGNNGSVYYRVYSDIDRTLFTSRHGDSYLLKAGIEVDARIIKERISVMHFICRKLDFMQ